VTGLGRKVRRVVECGGRRVVVTLLPATEYGPAMVEVREARSRKAWSVTVEGLLRMLAERDRESGRVRRSGARRVSLLTGRSR